MKKIISNEVKASIASFKASKNSYYHNLCPVKEEFKNWRMFIETPEYGRNDYALVLYFHLEIGKVVKIFDYSLGKRISSWDKVTSLVQSTLTEIVNGFWNVTLAGGLIRVFEDMGADVMVERADEYGYTVMYNGDVVWAGILDIEEAFMEAYSTFSEYKKFCDASLKHVNKVVQKTVYDLGHDACNYAEELDYDKDGDVIIPDVEEMVEDIVEKVVENLGDDDVMFAGGEDRIADIVRSHWADFNEGFIDALRFLTGEDYEWNDGDEYCFACIPCLEPINAIA